MILKGRQTTSLSTKGRELSLLLGHTYLLIFRIHTGPKPLILNSESQKILHKMAAK